MAVSIGQGVAQELRNVAQLVEMLRDSINQVKGALTPDFLEAVALANASLIRQIGTLERLAPTALHRKQISLNQSIERVIDLVRKQRKGTKLTFRVELPRHLPGVVMVESDLEEILWELLDNVRIASTRRGYATVSIQARVLGDRVRLSVEDDGPGIPVELGTRLLSPDGPADGNGIIGGIGLQVAQMLAQANGAELQADLNVTTGARLLLDLPVYSSGTGTVPILL